MNGTIKPPIQPTYSPNIPLTITDTTIMSSPKGARDRNITVDYIGKDNDEYLDFSTGTYTTTVTYSIYAL